MKHHRILTMALLFGGITMLAAAIYLRCVPFINWTDTAQCGTPGNVALGFVVVGGTTWVANCY